MREHTSHDVVLLCPECHQASNLHDIGLRRDLSVECHAPIDTDAQSRSKECFELKQFKSAAKALKMHRDERARIPPERVKELEKVLADFHGVEEVTDEMLDIGADMDTRYADQRDLASWNVVAF